MLSELPVSSLEPLSRTKLENQGHKTFEETKKTKARQPNGKEAGYREETKAVQGVGWAGSLPRALTWSDKRK